MALYRAITRRPRSFCRNRMAHGNAPAAPSWDGTPASTVWGRATNEKRNLMMLPERLPNETRSVGVQAISSPGLGLEEVRLKICTLAACPFPANHGTPGSIREMAEAIADRGHEV